MKNEILYIVLTALFAFLIWLLQGYRTRLKLRYQIRKDITTWRKMILAMGDWMENHRGKLETNRLAQPFFFEPSQFIVYEGVLSQLHLLSAKEIDAIASFYEWYRTFEHEISAFRDTTTKYHTLTKEEKDLTDEQLAFAIFSTYRIEVLGELLLENSDYMNLIEFKDNYDYQFKERLKPYGEEIFNKYGIKVW